MTSWLVLTDLARAREFSRAGSIRTSGGRRAMLQLPQAGDQVYLYVCRTDRQSQTTLDLITHRGTFPDKSVSLNSYDRHAPLAVRDVEFDPNFHPLFTASKAVSISSGQKWGIVMLRGMTSISETDAKCIDDHAEVFPNIEKGYSRELQTYDLCLL
ncbi:MAG: hypothetical protein ABJQ34_13670 [Paracoccaceae bacterium]